MLDKMAKIPNHILETLICSECSCYLSYGPIRLKIEGGAVCGRCLLPDNSFVSDTPYENLAKMVYFPCRYKKYGCEHQDKFGEVKTHEENCEFKEYRCPVVSDGTCQWLGSVKQILQHVENNHNDKVLAHPCVVPHTFTKNQTNVYITLNDTYLFLIHVDNSISSRKIRHWVKLIGSDEHANNFEFNLNIESPNTKLVKTKDLLCFDSLESDENTIVTSVTGLQEIFYNLDCLKFVATISTKTDVIQCFDCRCFIEKFVYQSGNIYKCEHCSQVDTIVCDTCRHEDDKNKMRKHMNYFCGPYISCPYCTVSKSSDSLADHITYKHRKYYHKSTTFSTKVSNSSSEKSTCFNKCSKINHQIHLLQYKGFDEVLCEFYSTDQSKSIIFKIYNYFDYEYLNGYDCHLQILGEDTDYKFEGFMNRENELDHDWILTINYSEDFDPEHEIEIKITFQKRDLYKHPKLVSLNQP